MTYVVLYLSKPVASIYTNFVPGNANSVALALSHISQCYDKFQARLNARTNHIFRPLLTILVSIYLRGECLQSAVCPV